MATPITQTTASAMTAVSPGPGMAPSKTPSKELSTLDQDTFMQLLLTQVKNQDPTSPMDPAQFMGQLAQLASVQGIQQLNQTVGEFSQYMEQNRALQAASLVGRQAMVNGSGVSSSDGSLSGVVRLPEGTQSAELAIKDASGNVVDQVKLNASQGGEASFSWNKGAAGQTYSLKATANVDGSPVEVPTLVKSPVESVSFDRQNNQTMLHLKGSGAVPLSQVEQVF